MPQGGRVREGVEIAWEGRRVPAYEKLITRQVNAWLGLRGGGLVSVLMTTTPRVQAFNRKYRGVKTPTAVMSFPQNGKGLPLTSYLLPLKLWGDIAIAVDAVRRYARLEETKSEAILEEFVDHGLRGLLKKVS